MKRIDTTTKAPDLFGSGKHGYKDGDKLLGIAATALNASIFNSLQEEMCTVIESTGAALIPADNTQLYTAIRSIITAVTSDFSVAGLASNFKAVSIGVNNYNCVITADAVVLENAAGQQFTVKAVSKTVNANGTVGAPLSIMSARAASTWYYRYLWYNATLGLTATLDASATAPTAPTGYVSTDYKAMLCGASRTDASGSTYLLQLSTKNRRTQYVPLAGSNTLNLPIMASGAAVGNLNTPVWVAVAIGNYVPTAIASEIVGVANCQGTGDTMIAPGNGYGAFSSLTNPPPVISTVNASSVFSFLIESANIYWANNSSSAIPVPCLGWIDN